MARRAIPEESHYRRNPGAEAGADLWKLHAGVWWPAAFSQLEGHGQLGRAMELLVKESKENSPTPTTFLTPYHAGEVHASFACFQTLLSPHFPRPGFLIWQRNSTSVLTFSFLLHLRLKKFNRDGRSTGQVWK